jgi:dienelactone hydrolase
LISIAAFIMWRTRHTHSTTENDCMDFLRKLRQATPDKKIGMVGFCWGGRYAIRAAQKTNMIGDKPLIDAVVALHPSNLVLPDDVNDLVVPVAYGWGVEDFAVSFAQKAKIEGLHADAAKAGKKVPEMEHRAYKPGRHGFAVRGNPDDPAERKCLEDSEKQALDWMDKWL